MSNVSSKDFSELKDRIVKKLEKEMNRDIWR